MHFYYIFTEFLFVSLVFSSIIRWNCCYCLWSRNSINFLLLSLFVLIFWEFLFCCWIFLHKLFLGEKTNVVRIQHHIWLLPLIISIKKCTYGRWRQMQNLKKSSTNEYTRSIQETTVYKRLSASKVELNTNTTTTQHNNNGPNVYICVLYMDVNWNRKNNNYDEDEIHKPYAAEQSSKATIIKHIDILN